MQGVKWESFQDGMIGCLPCNLLNIVITNVGSRKFPTYKIRVGSMQQSMLTFTSLSAAQAGSVKLAMVTLKECLASLEVEDGLQAKTTY